MINIAFFELLFFFFLVANSVLFNALVVVVVLCCVTSGHFFKLKSGVVFQLSVFFFSSPPSLSVIHVRCASQSFFLLPRVHFVCVCVCVCNPLLLFIQSRSDSFTLTPHADTAVSVACQNHGNPDRRQIRPEERNRGN